MSRTMSRTMSQIMKNRPAFESQSDAHLYAHALQCERGVTLAVVECPDDTYRLATPEQWKRLKIESE